jgi:hypothetical protein
MKIIKLIFLLLLFINIFSFELCIGSSFPPIVPSRLEGSTIGESVPVVELKAGYPKQTLRLALDFNIGKVVVATTWDDSVSETYTPAGGGSDDILIAGKLLRLPFETNPLYVAQSGCQTCEGVLGVGPNSPIWVVWKEATFSSGAVSLDSLSHELMDALFWDRLILRKQEESFIECVLGHLGLCKTQGLVGPNKELNTIIFSFTSEYTLVPQSVYDEYTFGKNVFDTPRDLWDDLRIEFTSLNPVNSKHTSVTTRIRNHDLVAPRRTGGNQLLLDVSPTPGTTYIGRTAFRSFEIWKDMVTNEMRVFDWEVKKNYGWFSGFTLIYASLLFLWLKGTPSFEWETRWRYNPFRIFSYISITVLTIVTIWVNPTRSSLLGFSLFDGYIQSFSYLLIILLWISLGIHVLMWRGYNRKSKWLYTRILGMTYIEEEFINNENKKRKKIIQDLNNKGNILQKSGLEPPINENDYLLPSPYDEYLPKREYSFTRRSFMTDSPFNISDRVNSSPSPFSSSSSSSFFFSTNGNGEIRKRKKKEKNPPQSFIHSSGIYESPFYYHDQWGNNNNNNNNRNSDNTHNYSFENSYPLSSQRAWAIISLCSETLVLFIIIMAWISTREDTLTGFGSVFLFSILIVNISYHTIAQIYHRGGLHNIIWYCFLLFSIILMLFSFAVAVYCVFYPFSTRFMPDYSNTPLAFTALLLLVLFYYAEDLAKTRVPIIYYTFHNNNNNDDDDDDDNDDKK